MVFLAINVLLKFVLGLVEDGNGSKIRAPKIGWLNPRPMFGGLTALHFWPSTQVGRMLPVWWETSGPMYWLDPFGGPIMVGGSWYCRRKFGNQTSNNMDRWKSRGVKSQRRERAGEEDQRRGRVRRKKMQAREKVAMSRNTVFFQWFVAPEGRRVEE